MSEKSGAEMSGKNTIQLLRLKRIASEHLKERRALLSTSPTSHQASKKGTQRPAVHIAAPLLLDQATFGSITGETELLHYAFGHRCRRALYKTHRGQEPKDRSAAVVAF